MGVRDGIIMGRKGGVVAGQSKREDDRNSKTRSGRREKGGGEKRGE